jgi:molybdopterin-guanine dinucleotide biosynthesis protein A
VVTDVSAAIVAGGQARRLGGGDKSRLVVRGRTIIVRQVEILQPLTDDLFLVSSFGDRHADLGLPVHPDVVAGAGAMGGLLTALEAARHELVIVVACDLPFLSAPLLSRLVELARRADAAWAATPRGPEPLLACYQRRVRDVVRARIDAGQRRLSDLDTVLHIARLDGDDLAAYGAVDDLVANVNTPDDLRRVQ